MWRRSVSAVRSPRSGLRIRKACGTSCGSSSANKLPVCHNDGSLMSTEAETLGLQADPTRDTGIGQKKGRGYGSRCEDIGHLLMRWQSPLRVPARDGSWSREQRSSITRILSSTKSAKTLVVLEARSSRAACLICLRSEREYDACSCFQGSQFKVIPVLHLTDCTARDSIGTGSA